VLRLKIFIPEENAFVIANLIKAGLLFLAKSNMAEWGLFCMHTESSTHGTTLNLNISINVSSPGSSGGNGQAAVAATLPLGGWVPIQVILFEALHRKYGG